MKRSTIIILLSLILSFPVSSQTGGFTIQFDVNSSISGTNFIIEIVHLNSISSLKLGRRDSISRMSQKDSSYIDKLLRKDYVKDRITGQRLLELAEPIFTKYKHFTKDSILIEREHPLNRDIQKFLDMPVADLKEKEDGRIVIDGHTISVIIQHNDKHKRFFVTSPKPDSEIRSLIKSALAYYRSKNPKILVSERETLGY